jgi:ribosomal protein L35AE/L33A
MTALLATPALSAPSCVSVNERTSMDARIVKEYLMVAALNCDARQDYNAFINKYNVDLAQHGRVMKRRFAQTHGNKAAEREVDRYVTAAANEASIISNRDRNGFCKRSAAVFRDLNGGRGKRIEPASYSSYVAPSSLRAPICQEAKR